MEGSDGREGGQVSGEGRRAEKCSESEGRGVFRGGIGGGGEKSKLRPDASTRGGSGSHGYGQNATSGAVSVGNAY